MEINDVILNSILNKIKDKGLTEKEILLASNVTTSFLSDWKAGRLKSPSFDKIYRISKELNLSLDSLTGYEDNNQNQISKNLQIDEEILLDTYRELNSDGKAFLQKTLRDIWRKYHS